MISHSQGQDLWEVVDRSEITLPKILMTPCAMENQSEQNNVCLEDHNRRKDVGAHSG